MKAVPLAARAALVSCAAALILSSSSDALAVDETVRVCIAASTSGQLLRKQGKLLASRDELIACARDACPAIVRSHCARWLSEVEAELPSIVVRAEDAQGNDAIGARLTIDGRPGKLDGQALRLDPGSHTVAIENDRGAKKEEHVLLVEGDVSRRVTVRFPAEPGAAGNAARASVSKSSGGGSPEPPVRTPHFPVGAWVLGGVGVASLGAATYFGLAASSQLSNLQKTCSPNCSNSATQTGRTDALVFDITLGVGAAAVVGALVWGFAFPSYSSAPSSAMRLEVRPLARGAFTALTFVY